MFFLIFCATFHETVCISPTPMPDLRTCHFVGKQMVDMAANERGSDANYRCIQTAKKSS